MTARANHWDAIAWINALRPSNKPYPLVSHDLAANEPGRALAHIYTNRFPTRDTLGAMLALMTQHFGEPTSTGSTPKTMIYQWMLTPTRVVQLIGRPGIGTFVQLIDTGDSL